MRRIAGWFLYFCYRMQNHYLMQVSLRNWLWVILVVPPALSFVRCLAWRDAILLSSFAALLLVGIEWARRRNYLFFEPAPLTYGKESDPPIQVDEQVRGWASGLFYVGDKQQYIVNERAQFFFVRSREHVVMVHLSRTRFLLLARSAKSEVGWWYAFFRPENVQKVETGYVLSGARVRPGLALCYRAEDASAREATIYMGFADAETIQRVLADLRLDVPARAISVR